MIVAITGGSGFIGGGLVTRHCELGDEVRYLTRQATSDPIANAKPFTGDLTSSATALEDFARGADIVYHCAAELRNETQMNKVNVAGTANLLAAARTCGGIGRWVQLSSTGVYGRERGHDRRLPGNVTEESPPRPANAYEKSKDAADRMVCDAAVNFALSCVIVQPSNVYGADMPNQSLFSLIRMIDRGMFFSIGRDTAQANYVHVDNVVEALMRCATATLPVNARRYIVSDHRALHELVSILARALSVSVPTRRLPESLVRFVAACGQILPGFPLTPSRVDALTNPVVYCADRIRHELGFENHISMEAGMNELVQHWHAKVKRD